MKWGRKQILAGTGGDEMKVLRGWKLIWTGMGGYGNKFLLRRWKSKLTGMGGYGDEITCCGLVLVVLRSHA